MRTSCETQAPPATKASAAAVCCASSRVASRTRRLVSTARMAALDVLPHPALELVQRPGLGLLLEERAMDVLRRIAAGAPDHHPLALFVPLQDRARSNAEPLADLLGYGDLSLGRQLRVCDRHDWIVPR